jgi:hypothetical protein
MSGPVLAVLYEAAQAEECFRNLDDDTDRIQVKLNRLYQQLNRELGKLASKNIDVSTALPPEQQAQAREV